MGTSHRSDDFTNTEEVGIVPRMIDNIQERVDSISDKYEILLWVSFLEI